jgi:hypothetical protein
VLLGGSLVAAVAMLVSVLLCLSEAKAAAAVAVVIKITPYQHKTDPPTLEAAEAELLVVQGKQLVLAAQES